MTRLPRQYSFGLFALALLALPVTTGAARPSAAVVASWKQAWPMVGHDPQQTGRSPGVGPLRPHLLWTYRGLIAPALIGPDSSVYGWGAGGLTALTATGKRRWTVAAQESYGGPPALGADGLLRVSGQLASASGQASEPRVALFAVASKGRRVWTIRSLPWATVPQSVPFSKGMAPIVTAANLFYVPMVGPAYTSGQNNGVEVVSPSGVALRRLLAGFGGPIALSPTGIVYHLGYNYSGQTELLASRPDGVLLWHRTVPYDQEGTVLVGGQGAVYVSDGTGWGPSDLGEVAAYTPAGHLLWHLDTRGGVAALTERGDEIVLVADRSGLAAVSPSGTRLWRVPLGGSPANAGAAPSLALDAAGHAYVGSSDGQVRAVTPGGTLLWALRAGGPSRYGASPTVALGPHGVLVVTGTDNILRVYH
jgi:putative pyrroloquinoline-quinone binding quinoprotein